MANLSKKRSLDLFHKQESSTFFKKKKDTDFTNNFADYLNNISIYEKEKKLDLLKNSKECVNKALKGKMDALSDIFKNFPLDYGNQNKNFSAATNTEIEHWIKEYRSLIETGTFHKVPMDDELNVIPANATKEKIEQLNTDFLVTACVDLLDREGKLKPEIIEFFHLEELFNPARFTEEQMKMATERILYSYVNHIVLVNLDLIEMQHDCDVEKLDYVHGVSKALFLEGNKFTPFFKETLQNYQNVVLKSDFVSYLKNYFTDRQEKFSLFADARPLTARDISTKKIVLNVSEDDNPNPTPPTLKNLRK